MTRPIKIIPPHLIAHLEWHPGMPTPWLSPAPIPPPPSPPQILPSPVPVVRVFTLKDYIALHDVRCTDADGNIFEHYPALHVRKDIFRDAQGQQYNFTPYNAAVHCEQNGLFLPSFALTCNIAAALYQNKTNPNAELLLQQYKDKGNGTGWHGQNTVINYDTQQVIHYSSAEDFGQTGRINAHCLRTAKEFAKATLQDCLLEDALNDPAYMHYVRQLTGLTDPSVLVAIGNYFGKPAKLWFPWTGQTGANFDGTRAAWFGCGGNYLDLNGNSSLGLNDAVRGVQEIRR